MKEKLEMVKETLVEEMEAIHDIKEEVGTKELLKAFGKGAIKGFIGATVITAATAATTAIVIALAKKMK